MKKFNDSGKTTAVPPCVSVAQLTEEIMLLIKDCFVGEITLSERGIEYRMENGQSFIISVQVG